MANAKGSIMIGPVKYLRKNREDAKKVLPERLHHYLTERLSPASWYPEEDSLAIIRALVQLLPGDEKQVLQTLGIATAKLLGEGIYSHLKLDNASDSSIYALWASMHDTGRLSAKDEGRNAMVFDLVGYSHPGRETCVIVGAYIQETLRMGGRFATAEKIACAGAGAKACRWRASW